VIEKVAALVTRDVRGGRELLVFDHPLEGGGVSVQLPSGTVEPGERPADAVLRELAEETGLRGVTLIVELDRFSPLAPDERVTVAASGTDGVRIARGETVRLRSERGGVAWVVTASGQEARVIRELLTSEVTRFLFHLRAPATGAATWTARCDCGAPLEYYWVPIEQARLDALQQQWLDRVRERLAGAGGA